MPQIHLETRETQKSESSTQRQLDAIRIRTRLQLRQHPTVAMNLSQQPNERLKKLGNSDNSDNAKSKQNADRLVETRRTAT